VSQLNRQKIKRSETTSSEFKYIRNLSDHPNHLTTTAASLKKDRNKLLAQLFPEV